MAGQSERAGGKTEPGRHSVLELPTPPGPEPYRREYRRLELLGAVSVGATDGSSLPPGNHVVTAEAWTGHATLLRGSGNRTVLTDGDRLDLGQQYRIKIEPTGREVRLTPGGSYIVWDIATGMLIAVCESRAQAQSVCGPTTYISWGEPCE